jgi:nucleotide-binding universal stress UspA family protein
MFKSILVPVDLAEPELASPALDRAVALASFSGGEVHLLYVRTLVPATFMEFVPPDFDAAQQKESEDQLSDFADKVALPRERVKASVRIGAIYAEVLAEATRVGADLIVIGSHRPAMSTYLIGSNAATIVRHAPCSVLVIREPKKA